MCVFVLPVANQSASAIPKTWRKANDVISAEDAPQMEDKVRKGVKEEWEQQGGGHVMVLVPLIPVWSYQR